MAEVKQTKIFTREQPCTKVDIHNCFYAGAGYKAIPVVQARGFIGINVPKYLLREGYAVLLQQKHIDSYQLTPDGVTWLEDGLKRHLALHPEDDCKVKKTLQIAGKTLVKRVTRRKL